MNATIIESEREIKVLAETDVLVAGAGVAGCAAALASARAGAKTILLERNGCLGGVATAGLMANIGNCLMDRDGRFIINGIPREIIDRMVARGAASEKWASREVPGIVIDSEHLKVLLIEMMEEAGVQVFTHTLAARPIVKGKSVNGVFIESKAGREAITAKAVVDTTGEADLARAAGCPRNWIGSSASLEFKMAGVNLDAFYLYFKKHPEQFPVGQDFVKGFAEFERNWVERGIFFFPHGGGRKCKLFQDAVASGELQATRGILFNMDAAGLYGLRQFNSVIINSNFVKVNSLAAAELSKSELETQKACYPVADFFRKRVPGFEKAYIAQLATDLGIRSSAAIEGRKTLLGEHIRSEKPVYFDDCIGCYPRFSNFSQTGGFVYPQAMDVPFGVMLPADGMNLLVASGKSISCKPSAIIRGMNGCMICGQAAGVAAALSCRTNQPFAELDIRAIQKALLEQKVHLGQPERLKELGLVLTPITEKLTRMALR